MKRTLIIALLFISVSSFGQMAMHGSAASRQFKDLKVWAYLDYCVSNYSYTIDTACLYSFTRLWKNLQGHADWQYTTYNLDTCFVAFFPMVGTTNERTQSLSFYNINNVVKYSFISMGHNGSPTFNKNGITYNGTTQFSSIRYFRTWANDVVSLSTSTLLDTLMGKGATDTVANTSINFDMYLKDTTNAGMLGYISNYPNNTGYIFSKNNFLQNAFFNDNINQGKLLNSVSFWGNKGLQSSNRNGLINQVYSRGVLVGMFTNTSYNFGLARNGTSAINIQTNSFGTQYSGTQQFLAIRNRAFTGTEMTFYNAAITNFVNRKTQ